jgi:hypothetical protein
MLAVEAQEQNIDTGDMKYSPLSIQNTQAFKDSYELYKELHILGDSMADKELSKNLLQRGMSLCMDFAKMDAFKNEPEMLKDIIKHAEEQLIEIKVILVILKDYKIADEAKLKKLFFPMFKIENQINFFKEKLKKDTGKAR